MSAALRMRGGIGFSGVISGQYKQYRVCSRCGEIEYTGGTTTNEGCQECFPDPTGVTLNQTAASLNIGETVQLTATVSPSTATDKTVTWSSSNNSVATVSANGLVTAHAAGAATITVTTNSGGKTASCTVTVTAAPVEDKPQITVSSIPVAAPGSEVKVTLTLENNPGFFGALFAVHYPESFKLKQIEQGDALGSMSFLAPPAEASGMYPNPSSFSWDAMEPDATNGVLVTLTFEIPADADEGSYPITISSDYAVFDAEGNEIELNIINGEIVISNIVYGDVDGNGKINLMDVVRLRQ